MPIENTLIVPIIRPDFIKRMLETLQKHTTNYRVIVIDQSNSDVEKECKGLYHLWVKSYRNLGFSKAMNLGAQMSNTPYITMANDDIEFIDPRWWQGIKDTFAMDEKIVAVNPMSPREGAWGYGLTDQNKDTWTPREGFARDPDDPESVVPVRDGKPFTYKEFTPEDYDFLLNDHPTWTKDTLCDGIAMFFTVFKREGLKEIGLLDERFYPGSGEDYDMMGRIYSCAWPVDREKCDPDFHRRAVGTTKSWIWHWWGKSKEKVGTLDIQMSRDQWNHINLLWPDGFDTWGHNTVNGEKVPFHRVPDVFIDEL